MHVHDLNPKKTLFTVILFVVVILIGFLTLSKPRFKYKMTLNECVDQIHNQDEAGFHPYELADILAQVQEKVVLIDLRDKFTFGQGHIPGAKNISAYDLTEKDNISLMNEYKKNGVTVVLYGNDQLQANGPCMWFREVGYDNVKVLLGGYNYYKANKDHLADTYGMDDYIKEIPRYDYAKVAAATGSGNVNTTAKKKPVVVKRRKKTVTVSGGC